MKYTLEKSTFSFRLSVTVMPDMPTSNLPACTPGITESKSICWMSSSMPSFSAISFRISTSIPTTSPPSRDSKGGKSGLVATTSLSLAVSSPELSVLLSALLLPQPASRPSTITSASASAVSLFNFFMFILLFVQFVVGKDSLLRRRSAPPRRRGRPARCAVPHSSPA